jgi:hypothetical protein
MYLLLTLHTPCAPSHQTHSSYTSLPPQGISYNNLSGRVFCGILSCLQRNSSLGSLDVSHNSLKHSAHVKESLRQFLRHNKGIRTLDLSHNKFTAETTNVIHLGLLENDGTYVHSSLMKHILLNDLHCDSVSLQRRIIFTSYVLIT